MAWQLPPPQSLELIAKADTGRAGVIRFQLDEDAARQALAHSPQLDEWSIANGFKEGRTGVFAGSPIYIRLTVVQSQRRLRAGLGIKRPGRRL
jgi:hypothetical protein